jgi:hypothetical protein
MPSDSPLDPENRALYGEILRAPPGYEVDMALATTYSLDFETALVIPATMAFQAAESRAQVLDTPLALLDGLERLAERLAIFCEAGRIAAQPRAANRLTALLEDTVTEVLAQRGGAFHPKIWVLRFVPLTGTGPVRLRLAILSRNLTTDRSWDLSLSLDGEVSDSVQPDNAPISALLRALPGLARGRPTPARNRKIAEGLARDVDRTVWTLPEGSRKLRFAVNGLGQPPFRPRVGRAMGIISPFLSPEALVQLTKGLEPAECWLLSRAEELAQMPPDVLARFGQVMVLDDLAETEDGEEAEAVSTALGLHAKVFVTERYPRPESTTDLTVGSGNATAAALLIGSNVEVFATLSGPSRRMGWVADHIAPERLGRFLRPWQPPATPAAPDPALAAEARLDAMRKALAAADLSLRCTLAEDGRIGLTLTARGTVALPDTLRAELWPLTLGPNHSLTLSAPLGKNGLHLGQFALADVTRWLGLRLTDLETGIELVFTLGTTLKDLPDARTAEILRSIIENREAFLRYIRLLLGDPQAAGQIILQGGKGGFLGFAGFADDAPILEDMVRSLSGDGRRLRDIERLMSRLGDAKSADGELVIPPRFAALWQVFRRVLTKEARRG